jgi:tRNA nucleotidyltransferase (CCA-adding enzyme)
MKTFLVGGAVRDQLLGLPVKERDWVVVGARPEELTDGGFRPVGRDFPVFLHPQTNEEHALARTERKTGPGYRGFETRFSPDVTLEQDLERRDLTVNAMARDPDTGKIVDPFGGRGDIEAKVLRHVSPAFIEDPLRVLRVARFVARFAHLGFRVAPETMELMRGISKSGELQALVPERVWQETLKALQTEKPQLFFSTLRDAYALAIVFPELDALFGVPQPERWHPEIDTGVHTLMVLEQAAKLTTESVIRFAALVHDLGKGETPPEIWPRHIGHENRSAELVKTMCARLKTPNEYRDLASLTARYHGICHRAEELRPATLLELLENVDALRRPVRFDQFLVACEADMRGRTGFEARPYPQSDRLRRAFAAASTVKLDPALTATLNGPQIAERIRQARIAAIAEVKA